MLFFSALFGLACGHRDVDGDDSSTTADCVEVPFWVDADGDGFGTEERVLSCDARAGLAGQQGDCDDSDPDVHPGAEEICGGIDDDCDGLNPTPTAWYADTDADGYGDAASKVDACEAPVGFVLDSTDCDDGNPLANPSETERCDNAFDDDCDGVATDGSDVDGDGYIALGCPDGFDCDDHAPDIHPGFVDVCDNGIDDDCDGTDQSCGFTGEFDLADAGGVVTSEVTNTDAGRIVDVGDTNGDGWDDVLVGALSIDGGFLAPGPISGESTFEAVGYRLSSYQASGAGRSIGVGDVNADGFDDVGFGAPYGEPSGLFVVYGPVSADVDLDNEADLLVFGMSGTFCGHGSDIADAVVGAYVEGASAGAVYVAYGPLTADIDLTSAADAHVASSVAASVTGRVVHAGADVNGDGVGDFAANSIADTTGGPYAGGVYVVSGPVTVASLDDAVFLAGPQAHAYAGNAFTLGDYDGDGFADVASMVSTPSPGGVYVVRGPIDADMDLADAEVILEGDAEADNFGLGLGSGDLNRDGVDELLVGAPGDDVASYDAGATYLVFAPPTGTSAIEDVAIGVFRGGSTRDSIGYGLAIGDIDGTSPSELVIGGPGMDETGGVSVVYAEM